MCGGVETKIKKKVLQKLSSCFVYFIVCVLLCDERMMKYFSLITIFIISCEFCIFQRRPNRCEMRETSEESPEVWREWILDAIRKIRSQKQRPSIQRICQAIGSHHKFHEDIVAEKLEQAVEAGSVIKVYNKGLHSYKSPSAIAHKKAIKIDINSDISRLVTKAVRVLGECEGSTSKSIENFVQKANNLQITDGSEFKVILKCALKHAVAKKMLLCDGKLYKIGPNAPTTANVPRRRRLSSSTSSPRKRKSENNNLDDSDDDDDFSPMDTSIDERTERPKVNIYTRIR